MPKFHLDRRAVLRGAGSVAIALPWLEIMADERPARAALPSAKRLINVFTHGGCVPEDWSPQGSPDAYTFGPILSPLAPHQDDVLVLSGVDLRCKQGEQEQAGMIAWLTGTAQYLQQPGQTGTPNYACGPSIDQVLAPSLSKGCALPSIELAVRWGTGKSHGLMTPMDVVNFATDGAFTPIAPRIDPKLIWQELFGSLPKPGREWDRSILDAVGERYKKLAARLGGADRVRLEQHLAAVRELETRINALVSCAPPELPDTSSYDPAAGLAADDAGVVKDPQTDAAIPQVTKLFIDFIVMALDCDLTRVATLMHGDAQCKSTHPWLGLTEGMNCYMSDCGYRPADLSKILTWYSTQHAYLLDRLASTPTLDGTLLDETIVFFGSNISRPSDHSWHDMPFLLAGRGGGLKPGRRLQHDHASHNDLLVALLNLCGDERQKFGTEQYCNGPLGGLT